MPRLTLYSTTGCHLCEQAEALIGRYVGVSGDSPVSLERVDIADDPVLLERYGSRIPVLRNLASGVELDWPFASEDLARVL